MLQDIAPYKFHCEYESREVNLKQDYLLAYKGDKVLLKDGHIPLVSELQEMLALEDLQFLFTVDEIAFYSPKEALIETNGLEYKSIQKFRTYLPRHLAFAGITGYHLDTWYAGNKFCGACGTKNFHKADERALVCPKCGRIIYPNISMAVVVAIIDGEEILLTKYPGRTTYALIAGFVEIGETFEDTCIREVMEEVGLKIKNLRFYGSQPWGFSQSMMVGYFAELDGSKEITLDTNELGEAAWVKRSEMPESDAGISLTYTMMEEFRKGRI